MGYTLQIFEVLDLVQAEPDRQKKIELLRKHNTNTLQLVLSHAFNPGIVYKLPAGKPPYKAQNIPVGYYDSSMFTETRRIGYLFHNPPEGLRPNKLEYLFIEILESFHHRDAELLVAMKDKTLTELYPSIDYTLVAETFPTLLPPIVATQTVEIDPDETKPSKKKSTAKKTTAKKTPAKKKSVTPEIQ